MECFKCKKQFFPYGGTYKDICKACIDSLRNRCRRVSLSLNDYIDMLRDQNAKCAICQLEEDLSMYFVNGKPYCLLCIRCRSTIGMITKSDEAFRIALFLKEIEERTAPEIVRDLKPCKRCKERQTTNDLCDPCVVVLSEINITPDKYLDILAGRRPIPPQFNPNSKSPRQRKLYKLFKKLGAYEVTPLDSDPNK